MTVLSVDGVVGATDVFQYIGNLISRLSQTGSNVQIVIVWNYVL